MAPDPLRSLYIGLMSGTSLDGVDAVLVRGVEDSRPATLQVLGAVHHPFDPATRAELLALNRSGPDELHRAALASNRLAQAYVAACRELLAVARVRADEVRAIGAHGQTVRHRPGEFDGIGYTIQLDPGALLAEHTGIDVVSNFRVRDVAAGGQGAPLVPGFHRRLVHTGPQAGWQAVLNLGGIANVSVVAADGGVTGFDCGPGNVLLDLWADRHLGRPHDEGGQWAATGRVDDALLSVLMRTPFVAQLPPKSTGRDLFNAEWLEAQLAAAFPGATTPSPSDVQSTLAEFTARCVRQALALGAPDPAAVRALWVCGGGTRNRDLMRRIQGAIAPTVVDTTDALGIDPQQVEAVAFAWLAACHVLGQPGSVPAVTGARGARVLGTGHRA
jgi:anhydro-N-acetylmuramic acid kinase